MRTAKTLVSSFQSNVRKNCSIIGGGCDCCNELQMREKKKPKTLKITMQRTKL